jgi:nucleoid-associated protein YejK
MSYFANLRIAKIVIHEIYKRDVNGEITPPRYNDRLTRLDASALDTLQARVIHALGDDSHSVQMDIVKDDISSTFQKGTTLLTGSEAEFIETSKQLCYHLAECQTTKGIPGGIVLIFSGTTGGQNFPIWAIIKADYQEGFVKSIEEENLILKYITDLLLTPQQKLYKLAVFIEHGQSPLINNLRSTEDFTVYVYDHNMTRNETQTAAAYFYRDFLGCHYSPTDKKLTQDFYLNTKQFINSSNLDFEQKNELGTALFTYLKVSQEQIVHVESFADEYLPIEEKENYVQYMEAKSFPAHAISKDLTYLLKKLRQRKITFTNNVKIIAPAENFNSLVDIRSDPENDQTLVIIKGKQISDK